MLHADVELARRLEKADSTFGVRGTRAAAARYPDRDIAFEPIGSGHAVYHGRESPMNEAKGLGLAGPINADEIDRLIEFYGRRGEDSRVVVCPLADASLPIELGKRGFLPTGFENTLYLPLDGDRGDESFGAASGEIETAIVGLSDRETVLRLIASCFFTADQITPELTDLFRVTFDAEDTIAFLARIDGRIVGAAMLLISNGVACLAGAGTIPEYRGRGVQTALQRVRLSLARDRGCVVATQGAQPGSTSQRNAERRGFCVAYTRALLVRPVSP